MAKRFDQQCQCAGCAAQAAGATDNEIAEKIHEGIERAIAKYGRRLMGVFGDAEDLSFTYTIGNQIHGLPELLVIGTHEGYLLNVLSEKMLQRGCAFADGELVKSSNGKVTVKIINADAQAREEYTIQAGRFFGGENYAVQQVLLPDPDGRFPDEPKCRKPFSTIPVLRVVQ